VSNRSHRKGHLILLLWLGAEGTLTSLVGKDDSLGRYGVYLGLNGRTAWSEPRIQGENGQAVTCADLAGRYRQQVESFTETEPGPVSRISLGLNKGITRLSLDYHLHKAPSAVGREVLCRAVTLALILLTASAGNRK
jgi:hypothetical protein